MKIYIQSKSGDFNSTQVVMDEHLEAALQTLRTRGGYYAKRREQPMFVPFEEIEYIREERNE